MKERGLSWRGAPSFGMGLFVNSNWPKRVLEYTNPRVFKGKEGETHMHQRAFQIFAGDLLTQ